MEQETSEKSKGVKASADDEVKPFLDHLEDLRQVLLKSLVAMVITCAICFGFTDEIVRFFKWPLTAVAGTSEAGLAMSSQVLRSLHPADFLMASLKLVTIVGAILASPVVFYFFWGFISPGLTQEEQWASLPIFLAGLVFFLVGVVFCYLVVLRLSLTFLWDYTMTRGVMPEWTFDNYISFVSTLMIAFGVTFELPVISALLAKFNLLGQETLRSKRRYAYLAMVILAAIMTPPDVISQLLLCIPMVGLYEMSIWVVGLVGTRGKA